MALSLGVLTTHPSYFSETSQHCMVQENRFIFADVGGKRGGNAKNRVRSACPRLNKEGMRNMSDFRNADTSRITHAASRQGKPPRLNPKPYRGAALRKPVDLSLTQELCCLSWTPSPVINYVNVNVCYPTQILSGTRSDSLLYETFTSSKLSGVVFSEPSLTP